MGTRTRRTPGFPVGSRRSGRRRPGRGRLQRGERGVRRRALRGVRHGLRAARHRRRAAHRRRRASDSDGHALMPCGRCRQLLWEHGGPDCLLAPSRGSGPMSEVLPDAFGAEDLRPGRHEEMGFVSLGGSRAAVAAPTGAGSRARDRSRRRVRMPGTHGPCRPRVAVADILLAAPGVGAHADHPGSLSDPDQLRPQPHSASKMRRLVVLQKTATWNGLGRSSCPQMDASCPEAGL